MSEDDDSTTPTLRCTYWLRILTNKRITSFREIGLTPLLKAQTPRQRVQKFLPEANSIDTKSAESTGESQSIG